MAFIAFTATVVTAGTPVPLSSGYTAPQVTKGGVQYVGSVTLRCYQVTLQNPGATGNIYLLSAGQSKPGYVLTPGASVTLGQYGGATDLDDIYIDSDASAAVVRVVAIA